MQQLFQFQYNQKIMGNWSARLLIIWIALPLLVLTSVAQAESLQPLDLAPGTPLILQNPSDNSDSSNNTVSRQDTKQMPPQQQYQQPSTTSLITPAPTQTLASPSQTQPRSLAPHPQINRFTLLPPPEITEVKAYILIDAHTGFVMAAKNVDEQLFPASLTKVLSLYIVASQLKSGQLQLQDPVFISKRAWQTGGSRMFVQVGTQVDLQDLIHGVATVSGNDATVALAEHIGGSEEGFVTMMNQAAKQLHMQNSSFADCNGLHNSNYSTAADLAKLTSAWIRHFPEYYGWFKEKWFTYNNIKQPNRNRLLWRDEAVDGVKTGFTTQAGYCLIASAQHDDTRLIAVVLGAIKEAERLKAAQTLLGYGFRNYQSKKLFAARQEIIKAKVALGKRSELALGVAQDLYITAPKDKIKAVQVKVLLNSPHLRAPIAPGTVCGRIQIKQADQATVEYPLVALERVEKNYWFFNLLDYIKLWFTKS